MPAPSLVARRRRARAPVCCAIVVRTSPSLSPLTTLAPPPSFSACPRRRMATRRPTSPGTITTTRSRPSSRAARCARFACNQRVLRGHSEGTRRPSGALSGHPRALRGQSAARRGHPRRSEGTQRHSQAIRGHSETILGHHSQSAALRRTRWQSREHRDPRRPRWPHRVLSVRRARVRVRVFAALAGDAWAVSGGGGQGGGGHGGGREGEARGRRRSACYSYRCEPRRLRPGHTDDQ